MKGHFASHPRQPRNRAVQFYSSPQPVQRDGYMTLERELVNTKKFPGFTGRLAVSARGMSPLPEPCSSPQAQTQLTLKERWPWPLSSQHQARISFVQKLLRSQTRENVLVWQRIISIFHSISTSQGRILREYSGNLQTGTDQ